MSDSKKYYYLKLKENFFDSEEIKILKSMENGYEYTCILLEMHLKSLKNEGKLIFQDTIPYDPKMLSVVLGHNIAVIEKAISIFIKLNLIEQLRSGEIFLLNIQSFIGRSSSEADRIRVYRSSIEDAKLLTPCTKDVQMYDKRTPKKELELEKELELKKEKEVPKKTTTKKGFDSIIDDYTSSLELKNTLIEFIKMRKAIRSAITDFGLKKILIKLNTLTNDEAIKITILEQSIMNSWKGIFALKGDKYGSSKQNNESSSTEDYDFSKYTG